eukprot:6465648-Amphidinium_carterae.1
MTTPTVKLTRTEVVLQHGGQLKSPWQPVTSQAQVQWTGARSYGLSRTKRFHGVGSAASTPIRTAWAREGMRSLSQVARDEDHKGDV